MDTGTKDDSHAWWDRGGTVWDFTMLLRMVHSWNLWILSLWDFSFSIFTPWLTVGNWNRGKLDHGYWETTVHTFMNCKVLGSVSYYFHLGSRGIVVGEAPCRMWQHGNSQLPPCTNQTSQPPPEPASLCEFALSTASITNTVINVHISKAPAKKIIFVITCLGLHNRFWFCFVLWNL